MRTTVLDDSWNRTPKQLHLGSHPLLALVVLFPFAELFQALWSLRRNAVHEKSSDFIVGKGGGTSQA